MGLFYEDLVNRKFYGKNTYKFVDNAFFYKKIISLSLVRVTVINIYTYSDVKYSNLYILNERQFNPHNFLFGIWKAV